MKRILLAALITAFAAGSAFAQSCETKAMSGKGHGYCREDVRPVGARDGHGSNDTGDHRRA